MDTYNRYKDVVDEFNFRLCKELAYRCLRPNSQWQMDANENITNYHDNDNQEQPTQTEVNTLLSNLTKEKANYDEYKQHKMKEMNCRGSIYVNLRVYDGKIKNDDFILLVNTNAAITNINLPKCSNCSGRQLIFKDKTGKCFANPITLTPNTSDKIDGQLTYLINTNHESVTIVSDGNNWFLI